MIHWDHSPNFSDFGGCIYALGRPKECSDGALTVLIDHSALRSANRHSLHFVEARSRAYKKVRARQELDFPLGTSKYYRLEAICTRTKNYFSMNDKIDFFAFRDFWGNFGIFEFLNITRVSRQSEALAWIPVLGFGPESPGMFMGTRGSRGSNREQIRHRVDTLEQQTCSPGVQNPEIRSWLRVISDNPRVWPSAHTFFPILLRLTPRTDRHHSCTLTKFQRNHQSCFQETERFGSWLKGNLLETFEPGFSIKWTNCNVNIWRLIFSGSCFSLVWMLLHTLYRL